MARIIVTSDPLERERSPVTHDGSVLLDERVYPLHLRDRHAAGQLVERLAWAVSDAEQREVERRRGTNHANGALRPPRRRR